MKTDYSHNREKGILPPLFSINLESGAISKCSSIGHAIAYSKATSKRFKRYGLWVACAYSPNNFFSMLEMNNQRKLP